ncbi:MAG: molybdopterin-binding protein [Candidatus Thiodiazotropha endolucinida]|nr:molybdopterin-binding protein [Candidatus Thiodiazotropha taylori]MCW4269246.1 molybdopterin-binding protein [Candidatus Thiodiazotropha endolucinida]
MNDTFGLVIIGDEILIGNREDSHLAHFKKLLHHKGLRLSRCWLLPDEESSLIDHLSFSMTQADPVFVCGGIGSTPDDLTRACAAAAADVPLALHPEAVALIEERYGMAARPNRIQMANLPQGAKLIPNPYNQIPGFSLNLDYFLPGFPQMAWPMAEWILDEYYPANNLTLNERTLQVLDTPESALVDIMKRFNERFPGIKLFSLPVLGENGYVELGIRGRGDLGQAFMGLQESLRAKQIPFR